MQEMIARLLKLAAAIFSALLICHAVSGCVGCQRDSQVTEQDLLVECDLSRSHNPERKLCVKGNLLGRANVQASGTTENEISDERLKQLLRELASARPLIILVGKQDQWIFYVGINFESPQVRLAIKGADGITIDGHKYNRPLLLQPGAHAFVFDRRENAMKHVFRCLRSANPDDS